MQSEIFLNGKKYLSYKRASEISGLEQGQIDGLCRECKIESKIIEGASFVELESLFEYKNKAKVPMILPVKTLTAAVLAFLLIGAGYFSGDLATSQESFVSQGGEYIGKTVKGFSDGITETFQKVTGLFDNQTADVFSAKVEVIEIKDYTDSKSVFSGVQTFFENLFNNVKNLFSSNSKNSNLASVSSTTLNPVEKTAIFFYRTINELFGGKEDSTIIIQETTPLDQGLTGQAKEIQDALDRLNQEEVSRGLSSGSGTDRGETSGNEPVFVNQTVNPIREIVRETVVERIIQVSGVTLEDLQKLNNELRAEIYRVASQSSSNSGTNNYDSLYRAISLTNKIDMLDGVTITNSNITTTNISGTTGAFTGDVSATNGTFSGAGSFATLTVAGNSTFDTDTLTVDSINNRVGIGTSTPTDTLSINGATYIAAISAPSVTTDRLYNVANDLYWGGNLVSGSAVGTWTSDGTNVWRTSGSVMIGTTTNDGTAGLTVRGRVGQTFGTDSATYFGYQSGINDDLSNNKNTAFGYQTLATTTTAMTGYYNSAFGTYALKNNSTGRRNTAIGYRSMENNITGYENTAIGTYALEYNTTGSYNDAIGVSSLSRNTTGNNNVASGYYSLANNTTGTYNTASGYRAGRSIADGITANTTGDYNIFIGGDTKALADDDQNEIVIGYNATGVGSNSVVLGNDSVTKTILKGNVGIGTTSPYAKLSVVGSNVTSPVFIIESTLGPGQTGNLAEFKVSGGTNKVTIADTGNITSAGTRFSLSGTAAKIRYSDEWMAGSNANNFVIQDTQSGQNVVEIEKYNVAGALYIKNNGNVGIGTTSPFALLSVEQNAGEIGFAIGSSTATNFIVDASGNVGVGTEAPLVKMDILDINKENNTNLVNFGIKTSDYAGYGIGATIGLGGNYYGTTQGSAYFGSIRGAKENNTQNQSPGYLAFQTLPSGGALTERMRISSTGNVSMGNSGSSSLLNVIGDSTTIFTNLRLDNISNSGNLTKGSAIDFYLRDTNVTSKLAARIVAQPDTNVNINDSILAFYTKNIGTGIVGEAMRINNLGNVGIGTTSPFAKLSVTGSGTGTGSAFQVADSANSPKFTVLDNGNVGIGTSSPNYDFTIGSPVNNELSFYIEGSSYQEAFGIIPYSNTTGFNGTLVRGSRNSDFIFQTLSNGADEGFRFINVDNTHLLTILKAGNVGIGTTTPWRTLSVNGTAAFTGLTNDGTGYYACVNATTGELSTSTSACGASSQRFKENIQDLTYGLDTVLQLRPVSFDWKQDFIKNGTPQIGFIAEEVELIIPEVIGYDDEGTVMNLDYPKLTSVLVRAMQDLINTLDERISTAISSISEFVVDKISSREIYTASLYSEKITIGTTDKPSGMTLYDKNTGLAYCIEVVDDVMVNTPGECTSTPQTPSTQTVQTSTAPTITITGNNPATVNINTSYSDLGATAVDSSGNSLIVDTLNADTVDTTTAGEYTITYTAFDGTLTSTSTRTVLVEELTANSPQPTATTTPEIIPEPVATTTPPVVTPPATTTPPVVIPTPEPTSTTTPSTSTTTPIN